MRIASSPHELGGGERAVALGTFDGVHLGHRRVIESALAAGPQAAVVTFDPHPRVALGNRVDLISTLERRLELIEALGVTETLVVP
ncbi:MAG: adenylyltransferase/cytidyltransferase family protein, partial [Gaiellaceae bacterium]